MESALYGVYTLVVLYQKSHSFASLTCSISDTPQLVCKHRTRELSMKCSIRILHLLRVYYEFTTWPAPSWLDSSVDKALHRYRRVQGFESRTGLNFFYNCWSCAHNCDDQPYLHDFSFVVFRRFVHCTWMSFPWLNLFIWMFECSPSVEFKFSSKDISLKMFFHTHNSEGLFCLNGQQSEGHKSISSKTSSGASTVYIWVCMCSGFILRGTHHF